MKKERGGPVLPSIEVQPLYNKVNKPIIKPEKILTSQNDEAWCGYTFGAAYIDIYVNTCIYMHTPTTPLHAYIRLFGCSNLLERE